MKNSQFALFIAIYKGVSFYKFHSKHALETKNDLHLFILVKSCNGDPFSASPLDAMMSQIAVRIISVDKCSTYKLKSH